LFASGTPLGKLLGSPLWLLVSEKFSKKENGVMCARDICLPFHFLGLTLLPLLCAAGVPAVRQGSAMNAAATVDGGTAAAPPVGPGSPFVGDLGVRKGFVEAVSQWGTELLG